MTANGFCAINITMDKKDIYEHLAKIYLDASSGKKKRKKAYPKFLRSVIFVSLIFVFTLSLISFTNFQRKRHPNSEIALVLAPDTLKINFHFNPAKKEILTINLNNLNLLNYKALGFSVRKESYEDNISLRVEFNNAFKEKSEIYFKDIPHKWRDYKIDFSQFKNISDWSDMLTLAFVVEEWNVKGKKGIVYVDNVRLLK